MALGTKNLVEALLTMEDRKRDLRETLAARKRTMEEALPRYFKDKRHDALWSRRQREMILPKACRYLGNPRLENVTPEMIERWRSDLEEGRSPATVKTYTIVLRAFFNWCVEHDLLVESPMRRMKRQVRVTRTRRQEFLTEEEREKLLAEPMADHIRFILMFGFFAGLRDGEMLAMTPRWIWVSNDWKRGTITVQNETAARSDGTVWEWRPKTRELRTIPMHARLLEFVRNYGMRSPWMLRPEKSEWPPEDKKSKRYDAHKVLTRMARRCGIRKLNYHILRHSFGTHLAMKGVPLAEIAGLLGDTVKVTEENYAGYSPSTRNPLECL